jgi:hypothetical protein
MWIETPGVRECTRAVPLNFMNGGAMMNITMRHTFPIDYYGKTGTYGTNVFIIRFFLKLSNKLQKLDDLRFFFQTETYSDCENVITIEFPSNDEFDERHTLQQTIDFFQHVLPRVISAAEYLQAHQLS